MLASLPKQIEDDWTWEDVKPYFDELESRDLNADNIGAWLDEWTEIGDVIGEVFTRASLAHNRDTADEAAETRYKALMSTVYPPLTTATTNLNRKLVESGLKPDDFEIPLKKMQADIDLYCEENLPLKVQENEAGMAYSKITGAQTVEWDGEELTLVQLNRVLEDEDRGVREKSWRLGMERRLEDREAINDIWTRLFEIRKQLAANAGMDNYRDYAWMLRKRFDYTPEDCETFQNAIEQVVVPAAGRIYERRKQSLGVESLRPWDMNVDPQGRDPLRPWETIEEFEAKAEAIFTSVDPQLGEYYATMRREELLDLPNRKNKRPGAFCTRLPLQKRPYVFMNAVGMQGDVRTLLHECGHAFHGFEVYTHQPYNQQRGYPIEFAEVASMAMELLAAPYLVEESGGYFSKADAARDRVMHLEKIVLFWPYMAVVDAFQHWAYTSGDVAANPANCDAKWAELWDRFMPHIDFSGLDDIKMTGWHRKQHIYRFPFYYIEYGLAQLGAVQVWANALDDQAQAVKDYRTALALGGTRSIPELYAAAGAKFAFDADTLGDAVKLIESTLDQLNAVSA